jgi:hypothetical protein
MAGPSGIKLNDLHVTDRGHTTEMFSVSREIGEKSPLRDKLEAKSKSWRLKFQDFRSTACWAIVTAAFLVLCYLGAGWLLEWADAHGEHFHSVTEFLNSAIGPTEARMLTAAVLAFCLLLLLEFSGVLRVLRNKWSFQEQKTFDEHTTFGKAMKLEADMIHFGNLPVSYDYTEKGLVVRSLGDRFVAVFATTPEVKVRLKEFEEAEEKLKPWFGSNLTPPVMVVLEEGSYKSKLILHGAHFETPGAPRSSSLSKAQKFKKAIEAPPRPDHGASGSH